MKALLLTKCIYPRAVCLPSWEISGPFFPFCPLPYFQCSSLRKFVNSFSNPDGAKHVHQFTALPPLTAPTFLESRLPNVIMRQQWQTFHIPARPNLVWVSAKHEIDIAAPDEIFFSFTGLFEKPA